MPIRGNKPSWLTFDCYGTLIQWDEGLLAAVEIILGAQTDKHVSPQALIACYDRYEHALEQETVHRRFRDVAGESLALAMKELGLSYQASDIATLTSRISRMPPFAEVIKTLAQFKQMGFKLCIISNTDDDIIAGNVAQLGGHIERVITAEQAQSYKPSRQIFEYAYRELGVSIEDIVHICASPHLDHAAAKRLGFRCIWINRGTGRQRLPDYQPDQEYVSLADVPPLFESLGWDTR